ncbi:hypothetical protein BT67DRAFT_316754 [Trichocladium antarcticum]|uniref:Uncharacterized protein n=1 Tax=Trichocladium antarcticum TaxID=1450529 RepID=A0AAN6ZDJ1_9PEZI|nr:hypothetical protein BT67DRAFT_316754 [Trichocladium antarcticum]
MGRWPVETWVHQTMMGALLPKSVGVGDGRHQSVPRAVVLIHDTVITWLFTDTRRLHDGKTLWRQEPGWSRKIIPRFPSPRITSSDPLHADKAVRHLTNPRNLDDRENRRCVDGIRNTTRLSVGFLIWSDYYQHKTQGLVWPVSPTYDLRAVPAVCVSGCSAFAELEPASHSTSTRPVIPTTRTTNTRDLHVGNSLRLI